MGGEEGGGGAGAGGRSEVILVENSHPSTAASAPYRALALRVVHHRCRGFGPVSRNSTFTLIGNEAEKHQRWNPYFSLELVLSFFLFETAPRQHRRSTLLNTLCRIPQFLFPRVYLFSEIKGDFK